MRSLRLVVLFCCLPLLAVAAGDAPASTTLEPASLRPARWSGAAARALSQSEEGEWNAVLATLPVSPSEVRERYLRAEALVLSGKHADAVVEVAGLAGRAPGLAPRLGCLGARSAMALEDWAKADRFLRDCVSDPIFGKGARVDRLLVEGRTSDARAAAVRLESLAGEGGALRDDALLAAATLLDETGRSTEALELLRRIFLDDPVAPLAPKALDRAKGIVTRLKLPPPPEARLLARAEKLLEAGQPKAARDQLSDLRFASVCSGASCSVPSCGMPERAPESDDKKPPTSPPAPASEPFALTAAVDDETPSSLPSLPACAVRNVASPAPALACRAQLLEAQLARKAKEHERAIRLGLEVYGRCADEAVRAKAVTVAAMSAASLKKPLALPLLQLAALQFGAHGLADDALLSWASRAREEGHGALERALLRRLVQSHPDSDQRAEALFKLFWSHRLARQPARGLPYLETLWKEYDAGPRGDGGDADRGRYWWGRTVAKEAVAADRARGVDALAALASERPLTFYGLLAASRLPADRRAAASPELVRGPLALGLLDGEPGFQLALSLGRLGFVKEAKDALGALDLAPLRADGVRGRESVLLIAELVAQLGDERAAHHLARRELLKYARDIREPLSRRIALVAFPLTFRSEVRTHATTAGFEPDFIQGLMREESSLDPKAKSPVGARGLTQLMPATAKAVAKSLGVRGFHVDHLWQPDTNIRIGSTYLGRLLRTFGHPGLAAAAYNAGPHAVARWLDGATNAFDEFVEQIPFSETRGYVKRVLRSYAAYRYLYEKDSTRHVRVSTTLEKPDGRLDAATGLK